MKNLEQTVEKVELKEVVKPNVETPIYQGLRLVEEMAFAGPTSIKYWM